MDERGVEPLAMKIFAGIVLLIIGLGIGYALYSWAGGYASSLKCSITLSETSKTISRGGSATIDVTVNYLMGTVENVTLQATGAPSGVNISFSRLRGEPSFYSTLIITVDNTASPGSSTLTISAIGSKGQAGSASLALTVT
ncbi:MAG: hypothetical protein QXG38_03330 [Candidatus Hadarchaeales archaeon]